MTDLTVSVEAYRQMWLRRAELMQPLKPAGEEWTPYPSAGLPDSSSPVLPGLELATFELQVITALADLTLTARDDPDEFHSFPFQETIQNKMIKAVEALEEVLF